MTCCKKMMGACNTDRLINYCYGLLKMFIHVTCQNVNIQFALS